MIKENLSAFLDWFRRAPLWQVALLGCAIGYALSKTVEACQ